MVDKRYAMTYRSAMSTNHRKPYSQPDRALWRQVLIADLGREGRTRSLDKRIARAADLADLAVNEYRKRITWRQP